MSFLQKSIFTASLGLCGGGLAAGAAPLLLAQNSTGHHAAGQGVQAGAGDDALTLALPERSLPALDALLRRALEDAPKVLIQRWQIEQSRANALGVRARMLPNVSGNASVGQIMETRQDSAEPDRTLSAVLYSLGLSQPVYHWGALSNAYEAAKFQRAIGERNLGEVRRLLVLDLRKRYFDCMVAAGGLALAKKNRESVEAEKLFVKKQIEAGFESAGAAGGLEAAITTMTLEIDRETANHDDAVRTLRRLAGLPEAGEVVIAEALPPAAPQVGAAIKALSGETVVTPSTAWLNLDDSLRAERLNYQVQKTLLRPKFGLNFDVRQDNKSVDNDALGQKVLLTSWNAFLTVNWTVFDGWGAQAAQRASMARVRSHEVEQRQLTAQERDERRAETARLQVMWRSLELTEQTLNVARAAIAEAEKERDAGWAAAGAVAAAQRGVEGASQAANAARAEFYLALATFLSNRGQDPALRGALR